MAAEHTSVPRWPRSDPGVDRTGRAYAVVSFGAAAAQIADGWHRELDALARPVWRHQPSSATEQTLAALCAHLATATVGLRLMVAGPQAEVLRVYSEATSAGVLDCEIVVMVTEESRRRVRCLHCFEISQADVATGQLLMCDGCGRELFVYHHVSRRDAVYMGFMADAEEMP